MQYIEKFDLVEHMKIHAYPPVKDEPEEDFIDYPTVPQIKAKQKAKRKKKSLKKVHNTEPAVTIKKPKYENVINIKMEEGESLPMVENRDEKFPVVDPNKPYVCQHCGVGFAREKALSSHTMVHVGDSAFECESCGDMFPSEKLLAQHNILKHTYESDHRQRSTHSVKRDDQWGTFLCNECGLSFQWYNQLKKHRK